MKKFIFLLSILGLLPIIMGFSLDSTKITIQPHVHTLNKKSVNPSIYTSGFSPEQIRRAYHLDQINNTGAGQTIAIIDAFGSPTIENDYSVFNSQFNLPNVPIDIKYPHGKPNKIDGWWAMETSLDVEWVHAIAPQAKILLVVAKTDSLDDLLSSVDYARKQGANVVSMSWGTPEFALETSSDSHFLQNGITFVASSGDNGSGTQWPASSPNVLSVGGTSLYVDQEFNWLDEFGWNKSGGGISSFEDRPKYQGNLVDISGTGRAIPDVAWVADQNTGVAFYNSTVFNSQSGWLIGGGTSVGAPCWSGIIALVNQSRSNAYTSFDLLTKIYSSANGSSNTTYLNDFHDIIEGNNGYNATNGFDLVTGLGTPKSNNLIQFLLQ